jgi:hypothetical protein
MEAAREAAGRELGLQRAELAKVVVLGNKGGCIRD